VYDRHGRRIENGKDYEENGKQMVDAGEYRRVDTVGGWAIKTQR
jgi:hypothetical protein